jgi:catechol 2,3-dioxygenase-like lactoylglutathione lyase family enzyme
MPRVLGVDHIVIRVSDFEQSKAFYGKLLGFLGFKPMEHYADAAGWSNGKTRFWVGEADAEGKKHKHRIGNIGFHHYAFELGSRAEVDALGAFVNELGAKIVDLPAEHYDDYYAVFFLDPDGLKLEGMKYGETEKRRAAAKAGKRRKRRSPKRRK